MMSGGSRIYFMNLGGAVSKISKKPLKKSGNPVPTIFAGNNHLLQGGIEAFGVEDGQGEDQAGVGLVEVTHDLFDEFDG